MEEKEYVVISKRGINVEEIDDDLGIVTTNKPNIPNRAIKIANPRIGSQRQTHWWLTEEEVNILRNDPRILAVTEPIENRKDIIIEPCGVQDSYFNRSGSIYSGSGKYSANWGLYRCTQESNDYNGASYSSDHRYIYSNDGSGVDVVIHDTGTQWDHPEWEDKDGNSRFVKYDWYSETGIVGSLASDFYTDYSGHGTHVTGIVAGKTYGWAKNSRIYAIKSGIGGSGAMSLGDAMDAIRIFHQNKNGSRPTIVNMSWGSFWSPSRMD
jgi:subtilisin family serine protease